MSTNRGSVLESPIRRLLVVLALATPVSALVVKLLWVTTLRELYGPLDLSSLLVLSVVLSIAAIFYVKTDAL